MRASSGFDAHGKFEEHGKKRVARKPRALVAFRVSLSNATGLDDALLKLLFNCFFNIAKETVGKWLNLILLNVLSVKNFFIRKNKKCKKNKNLASQKGTKLLSKEKVVLQISRF